MDFSKNPSTIPLPNLIQVQRASYEEFLQMDLLPEERHAERSAGGPEHRSSRSPTSARPASCSSSATRSATGPAAAVGSRGCDHLRLDLRALRRAVQGRRPARGSGGLPELRQGQPEPDRELRRVRHLGRSPAAVLRRTSAASAGMTYAVPVRLTFRLVTFDIDEDGTRQVRDVKEEELYFGELPLMTEHRDLHHQRHRAGHRVPAPPLAGRLLHPRGAQPLPRQGGPVPRLVDRVRVRQQADAVGAHRPQAAAARRPCSCGR